MTATSQHLSRRCWANHVVLVLAGVSKISWRPEAEQEGNMVGTFAERTCMRVDTGWNPMVMTCEI